MGMQESGEKCLEAPERKGGSASVPVTGYVMFVMHKLTNGYFANLNGGMPNLGSHGMLQDLGKKQPVHQVRRGYIWNDRK